MRPLGCSFRKANMSGASEELSRAAKGHSEPLQCTSVKHNPDRSG